MADFARDAVRPAERSPAHRDAAADAGAQDHGQHNVETRARAVGGLRNGQAIGVVGQPHPPAQGAFEIFREGMAVEEGGVGVADQACARRDRARDGEAHPLAAPCDGLGLRDQGADRRDRRLILARRRLPQATQDIAALIQGGRLDLGAAEIHTDPDHGQGSIMRECDATPGLARLTAI